MRIISIIASVCIVFGFVQCQPEQKLDKQMAKQAATTEKKTNKSCCTGKTPPRFSIGGQKNTHLNFSHSLPEKQ